MRLLQGQSGAGGGKDALLGSGCPGPDPWAKDGGDRDEDGDKEEDDPQPSGRLLWLAAALRLQEVTARAEGMTASGPLPS